MAETTTNSEDRSRDEAADALQALAREIRGDGPAEIHVGNKALTLHPTTRLEYEVSVEERSPMLGGDREEITVELAWEREDGEG